MNMAKKLTREDFAAAAKALGVDEASVHAVTEVESNGDGFLPTGEPKILFERHWMYKLLKQAGKSVKDVPVNIANSTRGGYLGGAAEHTRLQKAITYDRDCALQSTSWGLFQIMGFNYKACGYKTIQEFINAMYGSEGTQLLAFVGFVKSNPSMHAALKKKDWAGFAAKYNGPAYAENKYDVKLSNAYKKWAF